MLDDINKNLLEWTFIK